MAEFNVAAGRLKGSYDAVLISTDLEPDDAICLAVLAPMLKGVPLLCVVGEGPNDKRTMMAELLATFGIDEGEVDWKVVVINVADPLADKINTREDCEKHFPGEIDAIREWFTWYKATDPDTGARDASSRAGSSGVR